MATREIEKTKEPDWIPRWFRPEPGFKFRDSDGDPYIVLGWGGWREHDALSRELSFHPCAMLAAYNYKGEWYIAALNPEIFGGEEGETLSKDIEPGWSPDQEAALSGWM